MNAHTKSRKSRTVRRSVALPADLVTEVMSVARPEAGENFNRLVVIALSEFLASRKREAFAQAMARMAADPAIIAECAAVSRDFEDAERDGLGGD